MIDYTGVIEYLANMLDEGLEATVLIEPSDYGATIGPEVSVSLSTEQNKEDTIGSPDPYFTIAMYDIFCSEFSPDGVLEACRRRDVLMGQVRDLLKTDRTLGGKVGNTQIGDVKFDTARSSAGFFSAANLTLRVFLTT
jgi:hypothetical protein